MPSIFIVPVQAVLEASLEVECEDEMQAIVRARRALSGLGATFRSMIEVGMGRIIVCSDRIQRKVTEHEPVQPGGVPVQPADPGVAGNQAATTTQGELAP